MPIPRSANFVRRRPNHCPNCGQKHRLVACPHPLRDPQGNFLERVTLPTEIPVLPAPPSNLSPDADSERDRIITFISRFSVPFGWGPTQRAIVSQQTTRLLDRLRNNAHRA